MKRALYLGTAVFASLMPFCALANDKGGFVEAGSVFQTSLSQSDPKLEIDGTPYKLFAVSLDAGSILEVSANSKTFHPIVNIGNIKAGENCPICTFAYEPKKDEVIARINAKQEGIYIVRINTVSNDAIGDFNIKFNIWEQPIPISQSLEVGQIKNGQLSDTHAIDENGALFETFETYFSKGQKAIIELNSKDFDPVLEIETIAENGAASKIIDDNSGPENNSKLVFIAKTSGKYKIIAKSKSGEGGQFQISAQTYVDKLILPKSLRLNSEIKDKIEVSNTFDAFGEKNIGKEYSISLEKNKTYWIDAKSDEFDIKSNIGVLNEFQEFVSMAQDDDGGRKTNSFMEFSPSENGQYIVRISLAPPNGKSKIADYGRFSLAINEKPIPQESQIQKLILGVENLGSLDINGARLGDNNLYKTYSISLEKGQLIEINMKNRDQSEKTLDPFLEIGFPSPDGFEAIDINDDGGEAKNAKIKFLAPETKDYFILARSAYATDFGKYSLKTKLIGPLPPPPPPIVIFVDSVTQGDLNEKSPRFEVAALPYALYSFVADADKTYIIEAQSSAFDIALGVKPIEENTEKYQTNDDGGGGTNAKISIKPKTTGIQIIKVFSNNAEAIGNFTLKLSVENQIEVPIKLPEVLDAPLPPKS